MTLSREVAARRPSQRSRATRRVYLLTDYERALHAAGSHDALTGLLGGKGTNLAEMTSLGLPVPPGFVVTTDACRAFLASGGRMPEGLWDEVTAGLAEIERATGKRLGDPGAPLFVSCRSGAKFSMPGMMDTILDIGMNDETAAAMAERGGGERFAFDSYRRLVQMFGHVVLGIPDEVFEGLLEAKRRDRGVATDAELNGDDLRELCASFRAAVERHSDRSFPEDPLEQLRMAIEAVFRSWDGKRARDYRTAAGIPHDLGTAVNIVSMVFGNLGADSGTGVAVTRNVTTGEAEIEGDFLVDAQGEDVVSGTRPTRPIAEMEEWNPGIWEEFRNHCRLLEKHYRDVQDVEFTVERGGLWILQTRTAKRTAQAAIRIAVDLADEGLITRREALLRIEPGHVDYFLHPQFDPRARAESRLLTKGLNVSPGAAIGKATFDADRAERRARCENEPVILVRSETRPDDVHGMLAAEGVLTSRGGRTSHAALVARQFGKPAVVGALQLEIDEENRALSAPGGVVVREGDWLSIDGTSGEVFAGRLATVVPDIADAHLQKLLSWADEERELEVWANADYPHDAERARRFGAQGIGLCRTEHMFFESDRLPIVQALILGDDDAERRGPLDRLLPLQRSDFEGLFRAMDGLPVTIRLLDPPLHEFLPSRDQIERDAAELERKLAARQGDPEALRARIEADERMLRKIDELREQNPMLGLRGVRLGIHMPELVRMQVRAIFEAACACRRRGVSVRPKVMIPLTSMSTELQVERKILEEEARRVMLAQEIEIDYEFGTMIEIPRAALTADRLAAHAEFLSFGTNDLTQTTFGISRDDAETSFLSEYLDKGILEDDPFATIDREGVGKIMRIAIEGARQTRPDIQIGICGEHGGDARSIAFCHELGLDYVSCSPFRVPVARLASAHAAIQSKEAS